MTFRETGIAGVTVVEGDQSSDSRGRFVRTFDEAEFELAGLVAKYAQHSIAFNEKAGTVRGLHYQRSPYLETKIIRCVAGAVFDVAVDLRRGSPTFGRWFGLTLTAQSGSALYIPAGCAHGYQTLEDGTAALYMISEPYLADAAGGIHHADPELAITWPLPVSRLSERDKNLPRLAAAMI
ncbi:MAG TPA: dTDP-4-dehydrorhamnose 3,5-epimerase family protein [Candidatus Baltobacteraceae bacterium]|nr:dTDP-4-dehydrorhamnose 3,5-epimerase family protein [Candidatus Baltobacteraceae bacterium]